MLPPNRLSTSSSPQPQSSSLARRVVRWILKAVAVVAGGILTGLGVLFAWLWHEHNTELTLPAPTGHFAVGRTTYSWINNSLTDDLAPVTSAKREVAAWLWYPSS